MSVRVTFTRDSVAMGDDALAPHEQTLELAPGATVSDLVAEVARPGRLAAVVGGSTWALRVGPPGAVPTYVVAVIARADRRDPGSQEASTTLTADPHAAVPDGSLAHADYLLAQDPAATVDRVRRDPQRGDLRLPRLREQTERDWPAVLAILDEVARQGETYAMEVPASEAEGRAFWSGEHLVVAEVGARVLGAAKMGPNRPAQGAHVGTASFIVAASARGHGVGRALGEYVVAWHRERGFRAIQFNAVVESNVAAVRLWHSLGFRTVGVVPEAFRRPSGELVGLHVMLLGL